MTEELPRPRRRGHGCVWALIVLVLLGELLIAGGLALWYVSGAILPGVHALGVDLSGMTSAQASLTIKQAWQAKTITVAAGSSAWELPITSLGFSIDADRMAADAGREGRSLESLLAIARRSAAAEIAPVWQVNATRAVQTIRPLVAPLEKLAQDAAVRVVGAQVQSVPSAMGQAIDLAAGIAELERRPAAILASRRLTLPVIPLRPQVGELGAAAEEARRLLAGGPIAVRLYDPIKDEKLAWQITLEEIGGVLALKPNPDAPDAPTWTVNNDKLRELLKRKAEKLGAERYVDPTEALPALTKAIMGPRGEVKLRVFYYAREHTIKAGETLSSIADTYGIPYPWIQQANPGLGDLVRSGQTISIPSQDLMVPLPPVENKRIVVTLKTQKLIAYENGKVKWDWPISTGIPSSPTSPGVFQVQGRDTNAYANNWDLWMPYFVGFYRPVPTSDFMNGFHGFPKRGGTQIIWTNSIGTPVTYGCVLTTNENAKLIYDWAEDGVIVEVRRE